MAKGNKGNMIVYAIEKNVSEFSFVDWLENWGITEEEWSKAMNAIVNAFDTGENNG